MNLNVGNNSSSSSYTAENIICRWMMICYKHVIINIEICFLFSSMKMLAPFNLAFYFSAATPELIKEISEQESDLFRTIDDSYTTGGL